MPEEQLRELGRKIRLSASGQREHRMLPCLPLANNLGQLYRAGIKILNHHLILGWKVEGGGGGGGGMRCQMRWKSAISLIGVTPAFFTRSFHCFAETGILKR